jgi:hypothetical protein
VNRRVSILTFTFVALHASALLAQDITGTWQGTIHTPTSKTKDFREVIKISKDGTVLKAVLSGLDTQPGLIFETRPGLSFTSTAVNFQRNAIRMEFPGIGGVYQGTLSADGNSIAGGLSQNGTTLTLNLVRATPQTAFPRCRRRKNPRRRMRIHRSTWQRSNPRRQARRVLAWGPRQEAALRRTTCH